jgi:tRNA1Val (adenine37-N6)-methyltransferase
MGPAADEDLSFLTGDWRVFQKKQGHRWSMDDLVTAALAAEACPVPPARHLDLGCGIGSVLLSIAWRFPGVRSLGIEAQAVSAALCRRSIAWNGVEERVELREGDLREAELEPVFDLVTGTPPYFAEDEGVVSTLPQRGPCRFETRGGVEDYVAAGARALAAGADARLVLCAAHGQAGRIAGAAAAAGLALLRTVDVVPREGKAPLLVIAAMGRQGPGTRETLTIRDGTGQWTPAFAALREAMGLPPVVR